MNHDLNSRADVELVVKAMKKIKHDRLVGI